MYKKINLMVPTYHRVNRLKVLIDSVKNTVSDIENVKFSFCVNVKDTETVEFLEQYLDRYLYNIVFEKTKQPNLSKYFNMMYDDDQNKSLDIVSMIGDDMVFKTHGWDQRILSELNEYDGLRIVYCDDDFVAHEKCCVNMFTTRKLVNLTGKPFMCEKFHADMIDMVWTIVGGITGLLTYCKDIVIYHDHNRKSKKEDWDDTFKRLYPVQVVANGESNRRYTLAYAAVIAKNLIENGVGKWNVLQ